MSDWSSWEQCTATCGSGVTSRVRVIEVGPADGGKACPKEMRQELACNEHRCGFEYLPLCHAEHVTCRLQTLSLPNAWHKRKGLPRCGYSRVEGLARIADRDNCWATNSCTERHFNECHRPDSQSERELGNREPNVDAMVVSHGRRHMVQGGNFHCRHHGTHCACTCDRHAPCCARKDMLAVNPLLLGNGYREGVESLQDCCNLCTNHPRCTAWEYSIELAGSKLCVLKHGAPHFVPKPASVKTIVWAGKPSGDMFGEHSLDC